jgi:hypothetical protein
VENAVALVSEMGDEVVVGTAVGLSRAQVEPFLKSLRRAGYTGPVVLFVDHPLRRALADDPPAPGIRLVRVLPWLPLRWGFAVRKRTMRLLWAPFQGLWWAVVRLLRSLPLSEAARLRLALPLASVLYSPLDARFIRAWRYLRAHPHRRVLLSDVRDVLFQDNPFTVLPAAGLAVGLETSDYTLATQPSNAEWITRVYGSWLLEQIGGSPVSNVGVTYGDEKSIMFYLTQFAGELICRRPRAVGIVGADTAIHNMLLWTGRLGSVRHLEPLRSPLATLAGMEPALLKLDSADRLLNLDGSSPAIVHQYDRKPNIRDALLNALAS